MRRIAWMLLPLPLLLFPPPAAAQAPSAQASAAARSLASEGDALWDQARYEDALDRFKRAFGLVNAPTLALREAECLIKLGRLVEASEVYITVSRMKLEPGAPDAFRTAVTTAMTQATAIRERLPMLLVQVQGEKVDGAHVLVDGREVPSELIGTHFPVDPGDRKITVQKGKRSESQDVHLEEREKKTIVIQLPPPIPGEPDEQTPPSVTPPPPAASSASSAAPPPAAKPPTTPPDHGVQLSSGSSQRTWGWVGLTIGAVGLAGGTATGAIAMSKRSTLDKTCVDSQCPPASQSDVDSYNQMRLLSTIGFGVGVVGVGTGLVLLLTASDEPARTETGVRPWVGVGSIGAEGTF